MQQREFLLTFDSVHGYMCYVLSDIFYLRGPFEKFLDSKPILLGVIRRAHELFKRPSYMFRHPKRGSFKTTASLCTTAAHCRQSTNFSNGLRVTHYLCKTGKCSIMSRVHSIRTNNGSKMNVTLFGSHPSANLGTTAALVNQETKFFKVFTHREGLCAIKIITLKHHLNTAEATVLLSGT
jgi:hypothetical protein